MNGQVVYSYRLLPGADREIYDRISDITISMKAKDHIRMPELVSSEYRVFLSDAEAQEYQSMVDDFVLQLPGREITAANAGVLSGKLSQMANGEIYDEEKDVTCLHER